MIHILCFCLHYKNKHGREREDVASVWAEKDQSVAAVDSAQA